MTTGMHLVTGPHRPAAERRWRAEGASIEEAAERIGVHRRTAERYEQRIRQEQGVPGPRRPDRWMDPLILDHLRTHPGIRVSAYDLARVIGGSISYWSTACAAMGRLVASGQVEVVIEPCDQYDRRPVRRYFLCARSADRRAA
ncbi:hypothetical protein Aph01nite_43180 [Acrocarpospora phusangensis]|uniref:Uncharacterized protein n=1 Tax=Acrocarpospora phusangensis TaxID=1070424 RepID=A0A919QEI0_9ACTN|nr:helix-turn-helix domain-containing protein [Acrocarpospora phusangensis]GIH26008.1 hypothetical protein Aph01nite_43180 [Acrocarpospora phusangensis]